MRVPNQSPIPARSTVLSTARVIEQARQVLQIEAEALLGLVDRLDEHFEQACRLILDCTGRVVVTGIGKSGHIARKIAATLASTGTPAFFVHSAEAMHGDLGMVTPQDVVIALSNSGTTHEVLSLVPAIKRGGARLIAMTGNRDSELARLCDVHLDARGFGAEDFARSHPGGALGRRLLTHVRDVMHQGDALPRVEAGQTLAQAILEISRKRLGMAAVLDDRDLLIGLITDGDLRRLFERGVDPHKTLVSEVMSTRPSSILDSALAVEAAQLMEARSISKLPVVDARGRCVGALQVNDLLIAKVI